MRTRPAAGNPFGYTRYGFAWEQVPPGCPALLDVGCGRGAFLAAMAAKGVVRPAGVDVSREAVTAARRRCPGAEIRHVPAGAPLPFDDRAFHRITLLDVIEHVSDQVGLLREAARLLADGGRLVVTVPRRHAWSFLDLGNLKFRFPRLHRAAYVATHSRAAYERRYTRHPDGLVGDVSGEKRWHEHFSRPGLEALLARGGLAAVTWDGAGLFARPLLPVLWLCARVPGVRRLGHVVRETDARCFESANLFCVAERAKAAPSG
jgi:SAM-dependent methyltransferase